MPLKPHIQSFKGGEEKPAHNLCKHEPEDDIRNRNAQARWGLSLRMNGSQLWVLWCTASVWLKSCHPEMSGGPRRGRGVLIKLSIVEKERGRKGLRSSKTRWPSASCRLNKFKSNGGRSTQWWLSLQEEAELVTMSNVCYQTEARQRAAV